MSFFCIQETMSSVGLLRAVYKTSCWPSHWRLAREALTFNWPPVCFELHPPITIPHKCGCIKTKLHLGIEREERERSAANVINYPAVRTPTYFSQLWKPLSFNTHLSSPVTVFNLASLQMPSIMATKPGSQRIMKEKVTSSNNLLIGFGSFVTNQTLSVRGCCCLL